MTKRLSDWPVATLTTCSEHRLPKSTMFLSTIIYKLDVHVDISACCVRCSSLYIYILNANDGCPAMLFYERLFSVATWSHPENKSTPGRQISSLQETHCHHWPGANLQNSYNASLPSAFCFVAKVAKVEILERFIPFWMPLKIQVLNDIYLYIPDALCMEYLPTFGLNLWYM